MTFKPAFFSHMKEAWSYRNEPEELSALGVFLWRIMLMLAFIFLLVALGVGYWQFTTVTIAEQTSAPPPPEKPPLDIAQLGFSLDAFSSREDAYAALAGSDAPQLTDPSK